MKLHIKRMECFKDRISSWLIDTHEKKKISRRIGIASFYFAFSVLKYNNRLIILNYRATILFSVCECILDIENRTHTIDFDKYDIYIYISR